MSIFFIGSGGGDRIGAPVTRRSGEQGVGLHQEAQPAEPREPPRPCSRWTSTWQKTSR